MHALYFYLLHTWQFLESWTSLPNLNRYPPNLLEVSSRSSARAFTLLQMSAYTLCRKLRGWSKNCHGRCYELGMLPLCLFCCCAQATCPSTGRRKNVSSASVQNLQLIAPAFCINQFQWNSIGSFYNLICWHQFLQASLLLLDSRLHIHFWELGGWDIRNWQKERALNGHLTYT